MISTVAAIAASSVGAGAPVDGATRLVKLAMGSNLSIKASSKGGTRTVSTLRIDQPSYELWTR